jgi:hypothetical protein
MPRPIKMTRITVTRYDWEILDLGREERLGFDLVYRPGSRLKAPGSILTIETDAGVKGEVPGGIDAGAAQYLLGRNPLERDKIWHDLKRSQRGRANGPPGDVDVALWDIAGKLYEAPIHELLGGWRMKLPCYASTYHGDENGGLTRAEDYGDFALRCKEELGYPAFKIHGWIGGPIDREAEASYVLPVLSRKPIQRDLRKLLNGLDPALTLDAAAKLTAWDRPALIAWSEKDRFFPPEHAERLAKVIPGARLEWIEGARTFSPEDAPERLAALIGEFAGERAVAAA